LIAVEGFDEPDDDLSAALLTDEPAPRAVFEDFPVAVISTIVVADFPVHPPGELIVFIAAVGRDDIFGHRMYLRFLSGYQHGPSWLVHPVTRMADTHGKVVIATGQIPRTADQALLLH
jgi:hypothetical protein